jgi:hypothetical protein
MSTPTPRGTGKKTRRGTTRRKTGETVPFRTSNHQIVMVFPQIRIQKTFKQHLLINFELTCEIMPPQVGEWYCLFTRIVYMLGMKQF